MSVSFLSAYLDEARAFLSGCGYDPDDHTATASEMEIAMGEAAIEAAYQVMRERGLRVPGAESSGGDQ